MNKAAAEKLSTLLQNTPAIQLVEGSDWKGSELAVHRLDTMFPAESGNKIFKLVGHCIAATKSNKRHLLSFGGAWSNHLHALSLLAPALGFISTGIVRGLYVDLENPMLKDAQRCGMTLRKVCKNEYARRRDREYLRRLRQCYPDAWIIPEGGDDALGRWGIGYLAASLARTIPKGETLVVPAGTGAMVRGLAKYLRSRVNLVAALVVKDTRLAEELCLRCLQQNPNFRLYDASQGGYGRTNSRLIAQLDQFYGTSGILLDPIYNGKALTVAIDLASRGERVHLLHTGGIQGWRGILSRGDLNFSSQLTRIIEQMRFT